MLHDLSRRHWQTAAAVPFLVVWLLAATLIVALAAHGDAGPAKSTGSAFRLSRLCNRRDMEYAAGGLHGR